MKDKRYVSVIGLGYVGLPVAVAFGRLRRTIGFDIKPDRIAELRKGVDRTGEVSPADLAAADITYTSDIKDLRKADFHIVAVPTPVDKANIPDLTPVIRATETVGKALKKGAIVVYESTVYPGVTEDICAPILERVSGLKSGKDFKIGYSPERINPGDRDHAFSRIKKVVSGMDRETLETVAATYQEVVAAGVHKASSIKVAEAAKVIENSQRDINIAFMNELAIIFDRMGIDTGEVLAAAGTKWNFLKFSPGLVGGHCIGVDPYYLTHKAESMGYISQVILAGRRINDGMGAFIAHRTVKEMVRAGHNVPGSVVTVLGLTFKENCNDLRNSKVYDIIKELKDYGITVQVHDPLADRAEAEKEYGVRLMDIGKLAPADALVVAVAHSRYGEMKVREISGLLKKKSPVLVDVKGIYDAEALRKAGIRVWRL
ncbi:MAG TPA: nucleotide sugar dehydrogenase [Elusimicrobiales bacterium]|nr:nucleotide sugar dehydrogenase [Elusimicrobiales bacterium]